MTRAIFCATAALAASACLPTSERLLDPLPASCTTARTTPNACAAPLVLRVARDRDALVDDPALQAYVERIEARVARQSSLAAVPPIALGRWSSGVQYGTIVVGLDTISRMASEAELAGVLAHELAHVESFAQDGDATYAGDATDDENVADERAVELLARAGYPPDAMARALARLDDGPHEATDPHAPLPERIAHTRLLAPLAAAAHPAAARDEGREVYLAAIAGLPLGDPREREIAHDGVFLLADLDIAVPLPGDAPYTASRLGPRGYNEVRAMLIDSATPPDQAPTPFGPALVGVHRPPRLASSLDEIEATALALAESLDGSQVGALIHLPDGGGLLLALAGPRRAEQMRHWLLFLRHLAPAEHAWAKNPRVVLATAPRTATVRELAPLCAYPDAALALDDPDLVVHAGEHIKCADRPIEFTPTRMQ